MSKTTIFIRGSRCAGSGYCQTHSVLYMQGQKTIRYRERQRVPETFKTVVPFVHHCFIKMNEVIGTFQEVSSFALTCDVWTETMCTKSFLGVTAHYIHNNKMMSRCLATKELEERHTAD
ncbi:PREDICTED: uncharacterized protein LOC108363303 [Rhagoletis zephyria]|uniref:uncharacterized protein LOC108363303 n=1 Tax=Rhagoletis zephyria TaxID=28612 RepID=UPI000811A24F|nr:PREDICTED: uncharacterized protein LOC108363303 [Rhagoletis zephyria]